MISSKKAWGRVLAMCAMVVVTGCGDDSDGGGEAGASGMNGDGDAGGDGDGDGDGDGGAATDGGGGTGIPGEGTFEPTGEPIEAPAMEWTWIDFPDSSCRDGSMAGLNVSLNPESDKVMIFMQGGGACFDTFTCGTNPANANMMKGPQSSGLFNRSQALNPVADWNFIFVPYCTGDVHLGTKRDGTVEGVAGMQQFVGRLNVLAYLNRLVPTFSDASQVLLTGISAGGFGAAANMEIVQWAFGDVPVTAIDDSGPPMSSEFLATCLQEKWRTTWGFDESFLRDCGDDCPDPNDFSMPYSLHVAKKFPDHMGGLIETTGDSVITGFYGYGANDCTGSFFTAIPADTFRMGLLDYRERIIELDGQLGTFFIEGTEHTWLSQETFFTKEVDGVLMVDWFTDILEGTAAAHVGP